MTFHAGARRRIIGACLTALGAAACGSDSNALPPGNWTGDMHAPELPAAIGFLARVGASPTTLEIISLDAMGFPGGPVSDLRVTKESLRFTWTNADARACTLARDTLGIFEGDCVKPGDSPWRVRLLPPERRIMPTGYAYSLLRGPDRAWDSYRLPWGRMHIGVNARDATSLEARAIEMRSAIERGLKLLGGTRYDRPVDAFLLADRQEIRALSGQNAASTADALGSTVLLAEYGAMSTVLRHETMHVLSINIWGVPPEPAAWIREGIATFAGGDCRGYNFHQLSASFAASGELLPLRALLDEFWRHNDLVTYLQGASLFQYLYEQRGMAYVKEVWQTGLEPTLKRNGDSLQALEAEWRAHIANPALQPELVDWNRIKFGNGCG